MAVCDLMIIIFIIWWMCKNPHYVYSESTKGQVFDLTFGVHLTGLGTVSVDANAIGECVMVCQNDETCKSISFDSNSKTKKCNLNKIDIYSPDRTALGWFSTSTYITIEKDPWMMVFRAASGIELGVLEAWNNNAGQFDDTVDITSSNYGCLTVDGRLPCDRHFRFSHIDDVTKFIEAKFAFYTNGSLVAYVTFNASNAVTWNDVFKFDKIIASSIEELVGYTGERVDNMCNAEGYPEQRRHFYLQKNHGGCSIDKGWFFVSDTDLPPNGAICPYEVIRTKPQFRYSTNGSAVLYSSRNGLGYADSFAVFVKL